MSAPCLGGLSTVAADGSYLAVGSACLVNGYAMKVDASGAVAWQKHIRQPAAFEPPPWVDVIVDGTLGVVKAFVDTAEFRAYNFGLFR
ncbi:MAG: hypothetical protein ABW020_16875 [Candidatus Rokuibacteriota bacterium]